MPERLRAHRAGIDRLLQHVLAGVMSDAEAVSLDRQELWTLLDALPVAVLVSTDQACTQIWGNLAARQLYRLPPDQNLSRTATPAELPPFEVYSGGRPVEAKDLPLQKAAWTGQVVAQSECEIRFRDGRQIYIAGHSIPIRDQTGEVCGSIGAFMDLTPQRREFELSQTIAQEMSHRLKNVLAIVQSISRKTLKPVLDPQIYAAYEDRLVSLSRDQDMLTQQGWRSGKLNEIVELALNAVGIEPFQRILHAGPELIMPVSSTTPLSMILHELATNALKYGALSRPDGRISITWESEEGEGSREVCLAWRETGGPSVHLSAHAGFGKTMMEAMASSLPGGRLDLRFEPQGLSAWLRFLVEPARSGIG